MDKKLTNEELAHAYWNVVVKNPGVRDMHTYRIMRTVIANVSESVHDFWENHGRSLNALKTSGLGLKTKSVLELILEQGADKASAVYVRAETEAYEERLRSEARELSWALGREALEEKRRKIERMDWGA